MKSGRIGTVAWLTRNLFELSVLASYPRLQRSLASVTDLERSISYYPNSPIPRHWLCVQQARDSRPLENEILRNWVTNWEEHLGSN
jgi:hypothetical protein